MVESIGEALGSASAAAATRDCLRMCNLSRYRCDAVVANLQRMLERPVVCGQSTSSLT